MPETTEIFEPGDRVRVLANGGWAAGKSGTIKRAAEHFDDYISVELDDGIGDGREMFAAKPNQLARLHAIGGQE